MALPCYMAMTSAEFVKREGLPPHTAWMACHFSGFGSGLSNLPEELPPGSMVIVDDSTPFAGHQIEVIVQQLQTLYQRLQPDCFLLDFERPNCEEIAELARCLVAELPCPVGVSHLYAQDLDCPVFLPPPPITKPLGAHLTTWKGREIWLEISPDAAQVTVTENGAETLHTVTENLESPIFTDEKLACDYHISLLDRAAKFHIRRNLALYRQEAEHLGVDRFVGLYQELN